MGKTYHNNIITLNTIEYLKKVQKDGNLDVHSIITQIKSDYAKQKKEEITLLLKSLLPFYRTIKDKKLKVSNTAYEKFFKKITNCKKPKNGLADKSQDNKAKHNEEDIKELANLLRMHLNPVLFFRK